MNCKKVIRQLPAYLDDELTPAEAKELEGHLELCVFCSTELASLRRAGKMLHVWQDVSPRRPHVDAVIKQIRAEEHGVVQENRIGLGLSKSRWGCGALRAAAILLVVGAFVFSARIPMRKATESLATVDPLKAARELMLFDEDGSVKPSEWGLALRGALRDAPRQGRTEGDVIPVGPGVEGVDHIYFLDDGMRVESVIPVSSSGR